MKCLDLLNRYDLLKDNSLCGNSIRIICPFHDEKTPSLFFNFRDNFRCYGCEIEGSLLDFIRLYEKCSQLESIRIWNKLEDLETVDCSTKITNDESFKSSWNFYLNCDNPYPCKELDYLVSRGYDLQTIEEFKIKLNPFNYPIIIPIYEGKEFKGLCKRQIEPVNSMFPKYIYNSGFRKKDCIAYYCGDNTIPLLITEGILDAISAWQYGYKHVGAIFGWSPSKIQLDKLKKYDIICALDNDECGKKGYQKFLDKLPKVIRFKHLKKDINDLTKKEFHDCMHETLWRMNNKNESN